MLMRTRARRRRAVAVTSFLVDFERCSRRQVMLLVTCVEWMVGLYGLWF